MDEMKKKNLVNDRNINTQQMYLETCISNLIDFTQASHSIPIVSDPVITNLD